VRNVDLKYLSSHCEGTRIHVGAKLKWDRPTEHLCFELPASFCLKQSPCLTLSQIVCNGIRLRLIASILLIKEKVRLRPTPWLITSSSLHGYLFANQGSGGHMTSRANRSWVPFPRVSRAFFASETAKASPPFATVLGTLGGGRRPETVHSRRHLTAR
jgi:hypothetical protein